LCGALGWHTNSSPVLAPRADLYEICTTRADFGTRRVRAPTHHTGMDAVAVAIAVAFFAAMLLLIKAIDRI
jgi:hypothetical protein